MTSQSTRRATASVGAVALAGRFAIELWMLTSFVMWGFAAATKAGPTPGRLS